MKKEDKNRSIINKRVNIGPRARTFKSEGTPSPQSNDPLDRKGLSYDEALSIWLDHSQEAFEITAAISDLVVEKAVESRGNYPPYGLITFRNYNPKDIIPIRNLRTLNDLKPAMESSLGKNYFLFSQDLYQKQQEDPSDPVVRTYNRYAKLYNFAERHIAGTFDGIIDINAGLATAATRMTGALMNILLAYQRMYPEKTLTINEFASIARNSWSYIAKLSGMHRHEFSRSTSNPQDHTLVAKKDGYHLDYTEKAEKKREKEVKEAVVADRDKHPTFGCPAFVNFGDGSAIKKLWDWHIDIAVAIYNNHYSGGSIYQLLG